jgi:methionyl-tRNA formyltransferase
VTYAHKIEKTEAAIDWTLPAGVIERRVRAFNPFPGATTALAGEAIKVWAARAEVGSAVGVPGQVLAAGADGIRVQTGDGVLVLTELQRAGGKRLPAGDFLRGFALAPGQLLNAAPLQVEN